MLSILRGGDPKRRVTSHQSTIYYEDGRSAQTFFSKAQDPAFFVSHTIPANAPTRSMFNPPLHLHLFQSEQFVVVKGAGIWYQPSHPDPAQRQIVKRAGDPPILLEAGRFHHFENSSNDEELVVKIRIDPPGANAVNEERFFRNFFGYLDDCRVSGNAPSIFQLELFLHTVDGPLAIPVPGPESLKWWISRIVMLVLGVVIGEWLLGYKRSYKEYYDTRKATRL